MGFYDQIVLDLSNIVNSCSSIVLFKKHIGMRVRDKTVADNL